MTIPEPPWWTTRKAPRTALTREAIVDAAIDLLDREGIRKFSMRRLAEAMGTGAASLYWHVSGKDQLFEMIVDRIGSQEGPPVIQPGDWKENVAAWARQARAAIRAHPWLTAPEADIFPTSPGIVEGNEQLLGALRRGGVPDRVAASTMHLLPLFVMAFVRDEVSGLQGHDREPARVIEEIQAYFASLPEERFPNLRALAGEITAVDWDARFEIAIAIFIAGVAAQANR